MLPALPPWSSETLSQRQSEDRFAKLIVDATTQEREELKMKLDESYDSPAAPPPEEGRMGTRSRAQTKAERQAEVREKFSKLFASEVAPGSSSILAGGGGGSLSGTLSSVIGSANAPKERSVRPIAFASPGLPSRFVTYRLGALLPGERAGAHLVLVGPFLRGLWMLVECAGLAVVFVLMLLAARRLWSEQGGVS